MCRTCSLLSCILAMHAAAEADVKLTADFVGTGTYSPTTGCKKLKAIEEGDAAPNIATYPLTLTRKARGLGRRLRIQLDPRGEAATPSKRKMPCSEGAENYEETVTFRRLDPNRMKLRAAARHSFMSAAKR